jgi:hypothetical protein
MGLSSDQPLPTGPGHKSRWEEEAGIFRKIPDPLVSDDLLFYNEGGNY